MESAVRKHSGKHSTWYKKRIWKLQSEFADAKIN